MSKPRRTFPHVLCHYARRAFQIRRNQKRCPNCGAEIGRHDHRIFFGPKGWQPDKSQL